MRRYPLALIAVVTLAACARLGLEAPQSFNERLAYAASSATAVYDAIADATRAGTLAPDDAEDLIEITDRAAELMTSARRIRDAGNEAEASRQLALALAIITEVQRFSQEE